MQFSSLEAPGGSEMAAPRRGRLTGVQILDLSFSIGSAAPIRGTWD